MDVPPPIPLSQSENWKQIAADGEKKYRDELIRWSREKTRLLATIERFSAENKRLKAENERLKGAPTPGKLKF